MAMGKRRRYAKQTSMWVATNDLPRSAAHPFYTRLNQILDKDDFDGYVEGLCERFYAGDGRPGLPPGRYFRLLLIGYFEGLDAERAIAWHCMAAVGDHLSREPHAHPPRARLHGWPIISRLLIDWHKWRLCHD